MNISNCINKSIFSLGLFSLLLIFQSKAQESNSYYETIVETMDLDILEANLQQHVDFGSKEPGTEALVNSFNWIKSSYEEWGYEDISIDTFSYSGNECYNLIITKTGTHYPNKYVIIDGHYDTRNGPGANDNGTGTAIVMEIARMLKDIDTQYSVRFIHFSAEEVGLVGSNHYVNHVVVPESHNIKLVFNIDAVGGVNGMTNDIIVCERDESAPNSNNAASAAITDTLSNLMELYSSLNTEISYAYATDYVPFMEEGYVITGLYEYNETPYAHTPNDNIEHMDMEYFKEVAKGSLGASLYFTGAYESTGVEDIEEKELLSIYPNPVTHVLNVKITNTDHAQQLKIINQQGQTIMIEEIKMNTKIDFSQLPNGLYFLVMETENGEKLVRKINKIG
ncbi:M20/M25/M40 family metallo-hydrolase [Lentimicrobium sp. L6]|uniref:M20/M25/M40 family metallo-hydrolase n=1 Tax=Lentimicrobium sp. L6 TaxID=2735916 RepID=UPI001551A415|nr:M20/M25/M40 family metallo-hydrolase [Lentimicrobium sp. L6]NPD83568.1 M20/M25/M40 family metallo-hydrolase [Lentimicrobium sp. L6]